MSARKLTIQILGWNGEKVLSPGLKALQAIPEEIADICYIDNCSTDNSVQVVKSLLPRAHVIELPKNLGYAGAHNVGIERCQTEYILVLDQDVAIVWESIEKLLIKMASQPEIGAVQGKLLRGKEGEKEIIDSAGIVLTWALNGIDRGANKKDEGQYEKEERIVATTGSCSLYRLSALREVAYRQGEYFDRDFFAYKEDVDLGWRLNNAGWQVWYVPVLAGYHCRTLGRRGFMSWGLNFKNIRDRLKSPRTRYSFRNWIWMITKNASIKQELLHEIFIDLRILTFLVLAILHPPFYLVIKEALVGMPKMIKKRKHR
jgi:GT2 family glycosyltransferase